MARRRLDAEEPIPDDDAISEDAVQMVCAMQQGPPSKYIQHRQDIQNQRLERGWPSMTSGGKANAKGKGAPGAQGKRG
eukprot:5448067-Amphidinium_carterae.3